MDARPTARMQFAIPAGSPAGTQLGPGILCIKEVRAFQLALIQ